MRIVLSTPRAGWGGTATLAASLGPGLEARGHDVVLFCKPGSKVEAGLGDVLATEPVLYGIDFPPPAMLRCRAAFRRHGTEVVLSLLRMDLRLTGAAARVSGIPVVAHRAELEPFSSWPHRRLVDRIPNHWIANSEANARTLLATGPWLTAADVTTVPNGMDATPWIEAEPVPLSLPESAVAVGYVGRMVVEKGLGELADAWQALSPQHPELHLVLVGSGPWEHEFRSRLRGAERVHWLGYRRDVPGIMKSLDLVVMPSWGESFGLVAAEAMAASRPVVASRSGGLAEVVVDGETGRFVPPRDPGALADAIVELARDPQTRNRMGRAGLERVRTHFTDDAMVDAYERVLMEVLERG